MSYKALNWSIGQSVRPAGCKAILVLLANYADGEGRAYPGVAKLAELSCQNEKTVRRHLSKLESVGLIRRERRCRADGSRTTDNIYLCMSGADSDGQRSNKRETPTEQADNLAQATGQPSPDQRTLRPGQPDNIGRAYNTPETPHEETPQDTSISEGDATSRCGVSGATEGSGQSGSRTANMAAHTAVENEETPRAALKAAFAGWDLERSLCKVPGREGGWLALPTELIEKLHADAVRQYGRRYRADLEIMLDEAAWEYTRQQEAEEIRSDSDDVDMALLMRYAPI